MIYFYFINIYIRDIYVLLIHIQEIKKYLFLVNAASKK